MKIPVPHDTIQDFCEEWGITKLEVFGSAIRGDYDAESSDIDLLMTVGDDSPTQISLLDKVSMEDEISRIFDRKVDLLWNPVVDHWKTVKNLKFLDRTWGGGIAAYHGMGHHNIVAELDQLRIVRDSQDRTDDVGLVLETHNISMKQNLVIRKRF